MTLKKEVIMGDSKFLEFYNKLLPMVAPLEDERKERLKEAKQARWKSIAIVTCLVIIFTLIIKYTHCYNEYVFKFFAVILLAILAIGFGVYGDSKKEFETKIKENVLSEVLKIIGNIEWKASYDNRVDLHQAGLTEKYQKTGYDDIFKGVYKDVHFDIAEVTLTRKPYFYEKHDVEVFEGIILKFDMNKPFSGHTTVELNDGNVLNKKIKFQSYNTEIKDLHRINLEDIEFEKKYEVYSTDDVEARYLITTAFMDRLKDIHLAFNVWDIGCAFFNDKFVMALSTSEDLFSLGSLKEPISNPEQYYKFYKEIVSIQDLIDYFKLNQHIGL